MKRRGVFDRILYGAILMLASELLGPVPVLGAVLEFVGFVL